MKVSEKARIDKEGNSGKLYRILIPVENLSTAFMLWSQSGMPCNIMVHPSKKNENCSVLQLRHDILAADIVSYVPRAMLDIVDMPASQQVTVII